MTTQTQIAFETLLQAWTSHDDLRHSNATIAKLSASRARLDDARVTALRATR